VKTTEQEAQRFEVALHVLMHQLGPRLIRQEHFGLTPGQVFALHAIGETERCTVSHLAELMEVKPSAITVMLDRLERHGYVVRQRSERDRRAVEIHLTDAGRKALHQVREVRTRLVQHCLDQLDEEALEVFLAAFEKLADVAKYTDIDTWVQSAIEAGGE
jgi:DNA-binding MarR family transcriptional regulator